MILYFQNNMGIRREIGRPLTEQEIYQTIKRFLDEHNYKSYYTRSWVNKKGETYYDVGSHTEFFVMIKE